MEIRLYCTNDLNCLDHDNSVKTSMHTTIKSKYIPGMDRKSRAILANEWPVVNIANHNGINTFLKCDGWCSEPFFKGIRLSGNVIVKVFKVFHKLYKCDILSC